RAGAAPRYQADNPPRRRASRGNAAPALASMTVPIPRSDAVRELLRGSRDARGGRARGNPLECLAGYRRIGLDFLLGAFDCAFRHFLRALFLQLGQAGKLGVGQIEPIDSLREVEIRVDTRDHHTRVDREHLDADDRDADEGIDDEALVEDDIE